MNKSNKGITLIALVITVIVLLILAGVTITLVISPNGLIDRSINATNEYKRSEYEEQKGIQNVTNEMNQRLEGEEEVLTGIDYKIKEWLNKANINTSMKAEEVFNNSDILNQLMNSKEAVDYMVNDNELASMTLKSEKAIEALDKSNPEKVPTMTGYTSPKGEVIYSSVHSSLHHGWYAFMGKVTSEIDWETLNSLNLPGYLGYKFEYPVWIYKCYVLNSNNSSPQEMTLQKSNDGINWEDVYSDFEYVHTNQSVTMVTNSDKNYGRAQYWRLYITKASQGRYVDLRQVQFYGK